MIRPLVLFLFTFSLFYSCEEKENGKQEALTPKLVLPIGHTKPVELAVFSSDSRLVLTFSWDNTAKIWEANSGKLLHSLEGHTDVVTSAKFSSDGRLVLTASYDKTAKIWETKSGKLIHLLGGHSDWINSAQFSTDNQYIVTASNDSTVKIWETSSGKLLHSLEGHSSSVNSAQFSSDGKYLVTASNDSTAKIWEPHTGKLLFTLEGHTQIVRSAQFGSRGKYIVTASIDSTAKIWETSTGKLLRTFKGHSNDVYSAQFSPDGKKILTASRDSTAKIWDAAKGTLLADLAGHTSEISSAEFSSDGKYIITASSGCPAKIWETNSGKLIHYLKGNSDFILSAQFSADGEYIATTYENGTIKIWESFSGKFLRSLEGHSPLVNSAQFSDDEKYIVSASEDGIAKIWETSSGKLLHSLKGHSNAVYSAQFSPNGKYIATGSWDATAVVWETFTGRVLNKLIGHSANYVLASVYFSANSKQIITASGDGSTKIWETSSAKLTHSLEEHESGVNSARFSANEKYIVTASDDGTAKIWETSSVRVVRTLKGHSDRIRSAEFSSDGKFVVTASGDNTAKIWETSSGKLLHSLAGHSDQLRSAQFSADGKYVVTISRDETAKIWETLSGKFVKSITISGGRGLGDVNKSFTKILSINNATTSLHDIPTGKELLSWISVDSTDWVVTTPSGLFDASQGAMDKLYFVQGLDIIDFAQLKERYYEPGLWKKVMSGEKLREVAAFKSIELPPDIEQAKEDDFGVANLTFKNREGGIGPISVTLNGLEVIEDIRPAGFNPKKKSWDYELKLSSLPNLKKGEENLIEVRAWNEGHWVISRPLQIKFTPASTRGAIVEVEESKEKKPIPNIHILTCGVSDYTGNAIDLKYATKDAESMAKALQLGANKLVGTGKTFVYSLTDNSTLKPTKANIQKTFAEISKKSSPNDVFVVYLSGHGINWGGDNGDFYYLTSDAYSTELQAYNDPAIRTNATISSKELIELFKTVPSDKRVLMIDACASGKMVQNLVSSRDISSSTLRALDRLRDRTGFHIITGCAADAVSYEASRFGQGVLTYSLIEGIKGASLKENKFVDINLLFQHAKERVPELAKGIGGIQSPQVFSPQGAQSFDIGELDDGIKKQIPLPKTRPVFVRSNFMNEQALDDTDDLGTQLDEAMNELSSRGEKAPILFMDIQKYDEGCKISGKYKKANGLITATYKIKCDSKEQIKTASGKTAKEVVEKIVGEIDR